MALNPLTGQWEPDEPGALPMVPPPLQATPENTGGGAPAPVAPLQVVAPPAETQTKTNVGPTTTFNTETPAMKAAREKEDAENTKAREAANREHEQKQKQLELDAQKAEELQRAQEEQKRREDIARQQNAEKVRVLQGEAEKRRLQMEKDSKITTLWEDKGKPAQILAALLVGIGQYAAARSGQRNAAADMLDSALADDRQRKIEKFKTSEDFHKLAQQDIKAAQDALSVRLKEIGDEHVSMRKQIETRFGVQAQRLGIPQAQAAHEKLMAENEQKRQEHLAKEGQFLSKRVQSGHETRSHTVNVNTGRAAPDLTALDGQGKPYGQWRSKEEADKGRDAQAALTGMKTALDDLNKHLVEGGRTYKVLGVNLSGQKGADRDAYVSTASRYLQKLKDAGVLNPSEVKTNQADLDANMGKSPKEAAAANQILLKGLYDKYDADLKAKAIRLQQDGSAAPGTAAPAAPAAAPKSTPAAPAPAAHRKGETKVLSSGAKAFWNGEKWQILKTEKRPNAS